ncbi:MAG TPA: CinA family protein [Mycobacteriales bacterium]|nr:CinA family protein [Mycobacteriales bacterium]
MTAAPVPPVPGSAARPTSGSAAQPTGARPGPDAGPVIDPAEVHALLRARGETVAVAESLTGGLLAAALTDTPGASATFRGGLVVYATDLKAKLAGVPAPLLQAQGAVSPDVAAALAGGVRDRLGATYGLGLTGVAGPDAQDGVPVGTVYLGLAAPQGGQVHKLELAGDRAAVRAAAVAAALALLATGIAATEVSGAGRESSR